MNNIILVGFMGTGKSVVCKLLAQKLNRRAVDTDVLIEDLAGKSISDIFSQDGEQQFREYETQVLEQLVKKSVTDLIIATGGGIVLKDENWSYMQNLGRVICLNAKSETILKRVGTGQGRPLLAGTEEEVLSRINQLLLDRDDAYAKSDWVVETDSRTIEQVAQLISDGYANKI